jgi:hypothetical protein
MYKIGAIADLDEMLAANRLVDELKAPRKHNASDATDAGDGDNYDDDVDDDNESKGIPRIKLKVKPLQSSLFRARGTPKDQNVSEAPDVELSDVELSDVELPDVELPDVELPEVTPATISPSADATGRVELAENDTPTILANYYSPKRRRRRGDGPRSRAARAKLEAIRQGKKWYYTGEPCIYGLYAYRLDSNGKCRE